jgi:thiamine kinase-like enzyme
MPHSELPRRDAEAIARSHVPGEGAVSIERLGSGLVNESYCVRRASRRYSLRIPLPASEDLGVDRGWEYRVLARAAAAGIAPLIEYCEPLEGILVARWVDGCSWTPREVQEPANIRALALLARRIHGLAIPEAPRRMTPADWVAYYREALARRSCEEPGDLGAPAMREIDSSLPVRSAALAALPSVPSVLCHSDLHAANLVVGEDGPKLLDWEYAHLSEAFWDLAGWSCNNDLTEEARRLLLLSYLGRTPRDEEAERLEHLAWLYDYVCLLWSELFVARGGAQAEAVSVRARFLVQRLHAERLEKH